MENVIPCSIFLFNDNQFNNVRKIFNYDDVNKLKQDLDNLEDWIKKQNHFVVKKFDRGYLERLLLASKGSVEKTKKRFDRLCTMRTSMPELLQNFDLKNEFQLLLKWYHICVLPKPTIDNYRIIVAHVYNPTNGDCIDFTHLYRYFVVLFLYLFHHDYNAGYEVIFDASNFNFNIISKMNPLVMQKASSMFLGAFGVRLKRLHMISGSKLFDTVLLIIKQALTEKLVHRIIVHDNIKSLQNYISKETLPIDYEGNEKSIADLAESNLIEFCKEEHIECVQLMEKAVTDESCRLIDKSDAEHTGVSGSFKTLTID